MQNHRPDTRVAGILACRMSRLACRAVIGIPLARIAWAKGSDWGSKTVLLMGGFMRRPEQSQRIDVIFASQPRRCPQHIGGKGIVTLGVGAASSGNAALRLPDLGK